MSGTDREELCGSVKGAAKHAQRQRTAPAGDLKPKPFPGPKPVPVRLNGVKPPKTTGLAK